jgi:DNA-directed RNA polymerase specialized sigma24 family protein
MADSGPADKDDEETRGLADAAAQGDPAAWNELVERFSGLVWSVTSSLGLSDDDAAEVSQATWLRLVEEIGRIDPDRLGAWLADTARREADQRSRQAATRAG